MYDPERSRVHELAREVCLSRDLRRSMSSGDTSITQEENEDYVSLFPGARTHPGGVVRYCVECVGADRAIGASREEIRGTCGVHGAALDPV